MRDAVAAFVLSALLGACGGRTGLRGDARGDGGAFDSGVTATPDGASACSSAPTPIALASFPMSHTGMEFAGDEQYLYFGEYDTDSPPGAGRLERVPKCGGSVEILVEPIHAMAGMAVDAQNVYWTECPSPDHGRVLVAPKKAGGTPSTLATVPTSCDSGASSWLVRHGDQLYYRANQAVHQMSLDGGANHVMDPLTSGYGMAVDDTYVYTYHHMNGADHLVAIPIAGGAIVDLHSPSGVGGAVVVDGKRIFFDYIVSGGVVAVVSVGTPVQTVVPIFGHTALAIDDEYLYVVDDVAHVGAGAILRATKDGAAVTTLAASQTWPAAIVVDAVSIYWLNIGGQVMKLDKPH